MTFATDDFEFPNCLHPISSALHKIGISPSNVVIELPSADWWELRCHLTRINFPMSRFDGRGMLSLEFCVWGFTFRARDGAS